ncbi:MAG TPA: SLC13 family permease [Steroidobacteraceae bacterium]|nr:SLC13 family permease [Steroidobacteraceae bacterium]HQX77806.1 SLC13 family permease [Steroidobacteraceae bacterium]HQZ79882.1 SLC13 family permease [Steroidobacteraceae bacterium]
MALDAHAIAVLVLTAFAFVLFAREDLAIETSSLLIVTLLAAGFILFPYATAAGPLEPADFFLGFGNEALVAICGLVMACQGLVRTGALAPLGRFVTRLWAASPVFALAVMLALTAVFSAFMNNTPLVALMIPILTTVALRSGSSPSRTLMPMTFAAQIGGMGTPIGTSLNLLVIGTAVSLGVPQFHMFDFLEPAAIAGGIGILYLWLIAPHLLPKGAAVADTSPRVFIAQMRIKAGGTADGATLADMIRKTGGAMKVRAVTRGAGLAIVPLPDTVLAAGDQLHVRDTPERLMEYARVIGGDLYADDAPVDEQHPLKAEDQQTAELVVTPGSLLAGRTLDEVDFDERYQLVALARHRPGEGDEWGARVARLQAEQLGVGDVLLVQGPAAQIAAVKRSGELLVLDATTDVPETRKAPLALAIMAMIILAASLRIAPVAIAALVGVLLMVFTGCLKWRDATRALDSSMIFLTVAAIALSLALVKTGAAAFVAGQLVAVSVSLPHPVILSATMIFMAVLANFVSNSAAAVIGTPIAVELARQLGLAPEPFVLAVLFGVNMGYATPLADNCNLLVFSAGGYRFKDFVRVGVPLMLIMWLTLSWLLPQYYPL